MTRGAHSFDKALHAANEWLREIDDRLLCDDRQTAYEALRAVLHILRDRLPLDAVLSLSSQLPMLVRGLMLEGWRPQQGPTSIRHPGAFADAVTQSLPQNFPFSGLEATEVVFGLLSDRLDGGEVQKIVAHLPVPLRSLWPSRVRVQALPDEV